MVFQKNWGRKISLDHLPIVDASNSDDRIFGFPVAEVAEITILNELFQISEHRTIYVVGKTPQENLAYGNNALGKSYRISDLRIYGKPEEINPEWIIRYKKVR